jgi:hypothetical protein
MNTYVHIAKNSNHEAVLAVFKRWGTLADFELIAFSGIENQMPQSIRRRRRELVQTGDLVEVGTTLSPTGRATPKFRLRCQ